MSGTAASRRLRSLPNEEDKGGLNGDQNNQLSGNLKIAYTQGIPTLNQWGLLIFILLTALSSIFVLRRNNRSV